jgi:hypothetical protein
MACVTSVILDPGGLGPPRLQPEDLQDIPERYPEARDRGRSFEPDCSAEDTEAYRKIWLVEIAKMKPYSEILPGCDEIRTTEVAHLKPKREEAWHSEAIGTNFVSKSDCDEFGKGRPEAIGTSFVSKSNRGEI